MPENKDFELDDLDSFSFEEISLDAEDAENETLSSASSTGSAPEQAPQDPFGVWVKQTDEPSSSVEPDVAVEPANAAPDLDFLSHEELANLDLNEESKDGFPSLDNEISDLSLEDEFNKGPLSVEEPSLEDVSGDFDEVSLDDFVDFEETEESAAPEETLGPTTLEAEPEEEFLDIDIEIEDDIDDRELEILEGAQVKREDPETKVEAIAGAEEIDLSEFGDFGLDDEPEVKSEAELDTESANDLNEGLTADSELPSFPDLSELPELAVLTELAGPSEIPDLEATSGEPETELDVPELEFPGDTNLESEPDLESEPETVPEVAMFADVKEDDLRLNEDPAPVILESEAKDFFLEPDGIFEETLLDAEDEMDMERIIALENDLTKGIAEEPAPSVAPAIPEDKDLASRVLLKIESELSSIKQELSDLKKELSTIKVVPSVEPAPAPELAPKPHHGFFDEDEDETIALTGDELDNIFSTAEINETELTGETLEPDESEELIHLDADGVPVEEPEATPAPETTNAEDFLAGTALADETMSADSQDLDFPEVSQDLPLPGEIHLGVPDSIELEEDFSTELDSEQLDSAQLDGADDLDLPSPLDEDATDNLLGEAPDAEGSADKDSDNLLEQDFFEEEAEMEQVSSSVFEIESPILDIPFDDEIKIEEDTVTAEPELVATPTEDTQELSTGAPNDLEPELETELSPETKTENDLDLFNAEPYKPVALEPVAVPEPVAIPEAQAQTASGDEVSPQLKSELKAVLSYMDKLLANLPDEKIQEFAESEHFEVYKKLFEELGLVE
ncbi:MAG: hypothetical protein HKM05_08030 [Spirochaetales bacterium]|nr:hypothetical protein [Spirochaetales bacterium]